MSNQPKFEAAFPFQEDVLALPVVDLDTTADWYAQAFDMVEVERKAQPNPTVILERDDVQIGFAINGGDASQEGAAIRVANIQGIKAELESKGVEIGNWRVDERDGKRFQVFFVVAPDGLCYCFNEPI
ncbi:VOC family protein [Acaryochloris sp. 'Moss Beach']|uniref:VOC family protein n=1 Tax=Acaryochloris sp. 'Moss Beach' TaxID=2740837 RepID=UPI001F3819D8|nr:VOC family protein [Acaryochloris sp. 'Moss Beach']UJB68890.1 VOC family protein [Acaryochloris sp. 'Moss Beach']